MSLSFPDVTGLDVFDAACEYAAHGIPVAPFDLSKGKGKSCWNLVGYRDITTDSAQLLRWREQFGPFRALATSPGGFGCVVIDVDRPQSTPQHLREHLAQAVYVNTRPDESPNRGHYWFRLPSTLLLGNPTLPFGEVRCMGGGVVMPPYGDRRLVRTGELPAIPAELVSYLATQSGQAGAGSVDTRNRSTVGQFCSLYKDNARPHKVAALVKLHDSQLRRGRSPHDAMREALKVGLSEARIGYVPARSVIRTLREHWDRDRQEFTRLVYWAIAVAEGSDAYALKVKSDRCPGTDSREYV
ncbi:bifunctional DNA primase/polymerase [Mycolicibacterium frederiksbergense]|uniref:bifunctional DNA primase/polymerase n=1 Tax=Mycolicibacterium frederiksbergense TaxID=117567 RepID=UPI00265B7CF3|nr:bifunctional DNA primase/polymerase [Mycolicibacterium frederiksbergense]MDO0975159.1 bifunctional DNA primase/polymerase [Mycolicibacterium frederiksbergense]